MNRRVLTAVLAMSCSLGVACASSPQKNGEAEPEPPVTECAEPRSQACTREYIPVCGHLFSGERETYPNACAACADPEVFGRHSGACQEPDPDEGEPSEDGDHQEP